MTRGFAVRLLAAAVCCLSVAAIATAPAGARPRPVASSAGRRPLPVLPVTAAALYAPQTGQMLVSVQAHRRLAVASATKLMTALVTLQHVRSLSTTFTQNDFYPATVDSQIGLVPGERMTVHDLLLALMLPSADDAAEDLADNVGHGSVARFVTMMNVQARRLGLHDTHYSTPSGLDTPGNFSSAADLVHLAQYDLAHSAFFKRIVDMRAAVLRSGNEIRDVVNRNDLLGAHRWIHGVKTGHTAQAGYVLVGSGQRNGMALISAVLGTSSEEQRDAATLSLLDYGFGGYVLRRPIRAGEVVARLAVEDRPGLRVPVLAARSLTRIVARDARLSVSVSVVRPLRAPLPAQAVVGTATVSEGGRPIARVPVLLSRRLRAVGGLTGAARSILRPLPLLVIAGALGAAVVLARAWRRRLAGGRRAELETA